MLARRQIATLDIERIPSPGGKDIGLGESAFLDPRGRPTLVADNDDLRTYAVVGQVELSVAAAGQRLAVGSETPRKRSPWLMTVIASLVFHAAIAAFFLFEMGDEGALIEGGVESEMAANGSASADQVAAGDVVEIEILPVPMVAAAPVAATTAEPVTSAAVAEAVPAEPVESQTVAAAEVPPAAPVQPTTQEAAQPAETAQAQPSQSPPTPAAEAETAVAAGSEVEILAVSPSDSEPEQAVAAPSSPAPVEPASPMEPAETATAAPVETEETVAEAPDVPIPTPRPAYTPPPEPKKVAESTPKPKETSKAAARQQTAGSGGTNQADAKRGTADGRAEGKAASATNGGKRNSAAGNAAVSNYPGKVASRLRRSLRYPAAARREKLRGEVHVSFTVGNSGSVASARIARSSGSPVLDKAALETVRRAAPFPPIPDGAGRSSWPFTVPLAFTR